jgi:dTDP-4-amino-4,6-dideoxygalactose transaminase
LLLLVLAGLPGLLDLLPKFAQPIIFLVGVTILAVAGSILLFLLIGRTRYRGHAGFITTDSDEIASRVRLLRNHGLVDRDTVSEFGYVSRLDKLQAAVLRFRLGRLDEMIERRRSNAAFYRQLLKGTPIRLPEEKPYEFHTFVNFVSQCDRRDELQKHLADKGVQTVVHYNTPIHLQPAAESLGCVRGQFPVTEKLCATILALPANQTLSRDDIIYVSDEIRRVLGPKV